MNKLRGYIPFVIFIEIILLFHISSFLIIKNDNLHIDEYHYYDQIMRFVRHEYTANPETTVIPGYHFTIAIIAQLLNSYTISSIRLISFVINLTSIPIFYLVAKIIDKRSRFIKTLQYSFFPIIFPFFPLIYTDILSISMILLSLYFVFKKKYQIGGLVALLSLLVRQTNIFWVIFLHTFIYFEQFRLVCNLGNVKKFLRMTWVFFVAYVLFGSFIVWNQGLVWGNKAGHPVNYFNLGNIYFMFFLSFILFFPLHVSNIRRVINYLSKNMQIIILIIIGLAIFMFTFSITHPWNRGFFHLRNRMLEFFTSNPYLKITFFLFMLYSIFSMAVTDLYKKSYYLIYPIGLFALLPTWIIEQRYYMMFFTLFILFKKKYPARVEYLLIVLNISLSLFLFWGISKWKFFL